MSRKKSLPNNQLLKIPVGELEKIIDDIGSIQTREDILGELLVEFYELMESGNYSRTRVKNYQELIENAQRTLNQVLNYVELKKLVNLKTIQDYRLTYKGIVETPLKKAFDTREIILRRNKPISTTSMDDYFQTKSGISVPISASMLISDHPYNLG